MSEELNKTVAEVNEALELINLAIVANKYLAVGLSLGLGLKHESDLDTKYLSIGQHGNNLQDIKKKLRIIEDLLDDLVEQTRAKE